MNEDRFGNSRGSRGIAAKCLSNVRLSIGRTSSRPLTENGPPFGGSYYMLRSRIIRHKTNLRLRHVPLRQLIHITGTIRGLHWRLRRRHPRWIGEIKKLRHIHLRGVAFG